MEKFIDDDSVCLILGDNIFYRYELASRLKSAKKRAENKRVATLFASPVKKPKEFGIVNYKSDGSVGEIVEKPEIPNQIMLSLVCIFIQMKCLNS